MTGPTIWIFITIALIAANLPWLSDRLFGLIPLPNGTKAGWLRLLEWLIFYFITGGIAIGLEKKLTGGIHPQDWEFYVIGLCLFLVFALPGYIYLYDFKKKKCNYN